MNRRVRIASAVKAVVDQGLKPVITINNDGSTTIVGQPVENADLDPVDIRNADIINQLGQIGQTGTGQQNARKN